MQMKLFCTLILISLITLTAVSNPVKIKNGFSVQNNFSDVLDNGKKAKKKSAIKLYPNPSSNGVITVSSSINEPLHFYVFDLEGTLLHRIALKGKEQKTITNLKKGTYMYDVFKNDESIEQGKIIVK
jgi:hypothetical protein